MKEYKSIYKVLEARAIAYGTESGRKPTLDSLDEEINKMAKDGWIIKFFNVASFNIMSGEPDVVFYALLEREIDK
jgi:hypothetical protein